MTEPENPSGNSRHAASAQARARAPVTDRVNVEPSILRGMTVTEAKVITVITVPSCLFMGGVLFLVTGIWQLLLILAVFGPIACLWFGSAYLQEIKRGRPDGYYTQAIHLWLARRGYVRSRFITHDGQWDLGRTLEFTLESPLHPRPARTPSNSDAASRQRR
ncbi:MAG: TIGR03750 family conjugal transfer protein [Hydrogenophaga sp.]